MAEKHFHEQTEHTNSYLVPYFRKHLPEFDGFKILEIGCAEAGFLHVIQSLGHECVGLELSSARVRTALQKNSNLKIFVGDITDGKVADLIGTTFDLIVMRDTIEHIPNRFDTFANIDRLLRSEGFLYVTFPPRYSGFAGHQQNGRSVLRFVPYLHLLPSPVIRILGNLLNERRALIEGVIQNYTDGLTIRTFERFCSEFHFNAIVKDLFLLRPIYEIRFHVKPRRVPNVPLLRELVAFGCEYLLQKSR